MSGAPNTYAFPSTMYGQDRSISFAGMTLRDYFAAHADQPGVSEIVAMAGGETDGFHVKFSRDGTKCTFNEWWNGLPLTDRLALSAKVRFAQADALLAERERGGDA